MKNKLLLFLTTTLFVISCELFESEDNDKTSPEIYVSIKGGNEISRGVTLCLDIIDGSDIDTLRVFIDDSVATTETSNFDTVSFDVTPFADESKHQLYVRVTDSEGNVGESEKLDVVITEFPGWRVYATIDTKTWNSSFELDDNGRIWIATTEQVLIYDTNTNILTALNPQNGQLPESYVTDIETVVGSRVWIATDNYITEYNYNTNLILKSVKVPFNEFDDFDIIYFSITIDSDYNIWIGGKSNLLYYNHSEFKHIPNNIDSGWYRIWQMIQGKNNVLYISDDYRIWTVQDTIADLISDDNYHNFNFGSKIVLDSLGNIWSSGLWKFDGSLWHLNKPRPSLTRSYIAEPLMVGTDNTIFADIYEFSIINGVNEYVNIGLATFKDNIWTYWNNFDSPFSVPHDSIGSKQYLNGYQSIAETPDGDLWMVVNGKLMRYRPSLGGYP